MGKSQSIQQMESKEDEYRAYLTKIQEQLNQRANTAEKDMDDHISAFYKENNYDKINFVSGKNSDFMQSSEWSLDNVKKIIDAISKAVFGASGNVPVDTTVENKEKVSTSILESENLQLYIANKCFDVLSGIITSFGSSSSLSYSSSYKEVSLGNGLHLFTTVIADSYKSESFFENQEIYQYLYIYKVFFSTAEARTEAKIDIVSLYEDQVETFKNKIEALLQELTDDKISAEQYENVSEIYQNLINQTVAKLDAIKSSISNLNNQ
jgi:hypothetical protein